MKSEIEQKRYKSQDADLIIRKSNDQICHIWIEPESECFTVSARHMEAIIRCFDALEMIDNG